MPVTVATSQLEIGYTILIKGSVYKVSTIVPGEIWLDLYCPHPKNNKRPALEIKLEKGPGISVEKLTKAEYFSHSNHPDRRNKQIRI